MELLFKIVVSAAIGSAGNLLFGWYGLIITVPIAFYIGTL